MPSTGRGDSALPLSRAQLFGRARETRGEASPGRAKLGLWASSPPPGVSRLPHFRDSMVALWAVAPGQVTPMKMKEKGYVFESNETLIPQLRFQPQSEAT